MKRLSSLPFFLGLALGAALLSFVINAQDEDEPPTIYGDPDGEESDGEVSSFVD